jgi:hypothetical protein
MPLGRAISPLVRTATTTAACPPAVLRVGDALRERRRFTEADVAAYAAVSGDRNPVHLDDGAAREAGGFERGRVVHGMLVASLFPSTIAARFVRAPSPSPSPSLAFRRTLHGRGTHAVAWWCGAAWRGVREPNPQVRLAGARRRRGGCPGPGPPHQEDGGGGGKQQHDQPIRVRGVCPSYLLFTKG